MKICVLLKKTPDTEARIKISGNAVDTSALKFVMNPYDEFGLEQALRVKDADATTEVVVISFGDEACREILVKGLAMGADRGVLIEGSSSDSLTVARELAEIIRRENPSLVMCGRHAIDDDNMHVATMLAELLDWPHVNVVTKMEFASGKVTAERTVEGGLIEVYDVVLPAVFGADKSLNQPRYASLPNILKAKKKPIDVLKATQAPRASSLALAQLQYPPDKAPPRFFKGEAAEVAAQLIQALKAEAKVL